MSPISAIALSGVQAATRRFEAAASNIANQRSAGATTASAGDTPYAPLEVRQTAQASGGVIADIAPSSRAAILQYDPTSPVADANGYVAAPDIDFISELVDLATASYSFTANLRVLDSENQMMKDVLDIAV